MYLSLYNRCIILAVENDLPIEVVNYLMVLSLYVY